MDLRTLVASILASITSGDANSVYALALVARDELGLTKYLPWLLKKLCGS